MGDEEGTHYGLCRNPATFRGIYNETPDIIEGGKALMGT